MRLTDTFREMIHGTLIEDPYRWIEDRSLPETAGWIRDQQLRCDRYFAACPSLNAIESRVREYLDVEVIDQPARIGDRYFYRKRYRGQEQGVICTRGITDDSERVLVDPAENGRFTSVGIHRISADGSVLAYELKHGGEDRKEIRFLDVNASTALPNRIPLGYGRGVAFSRNGYFYCHEIDPTAQEHRIYYAPFGPEQNEIAFRSPRSRGSRLLLTGSTRRLGAVSLRPEREDVLTDFWIGEVVDGGADWTHVFQARRGRYSPILWHDRILVLTEGAEGTSRLMELSSQGEELGFFGPEGDSAVRQIVMTRDRVFVKQVDRSVTTVNAWLPSGESAGSLELPRGGTIRLLPVPTDSAESLFYSFESFDIPPSIYCYGAQTDASLLWHQRGSDNRVRCSSVREGVFTSKDGTSVEVTLVSAERGDRPSGQRPVIMTAYGGFGVPITPRFSILAAILMDLGATFVLPHIRGGGELGKPWHDAGRRRNRQSSIDDFVSAAEWLCEQEVTIPDRLAIFGGSNSGLLVGAALTQHPKLFRAVLCIAPLLDMLRYEYFDHATDWRTEYGTVEDREDFQVLLAYSPYHHVAEDVNYPATMFVTGDKDSRCNPAHVRKMAARLQNRVAQSNSVIADYSEERGHSPTLPLSVRVEALARRIAFLVRELQITVPDGGLDEPSGS